jgi:hypothetical protein
VGLRSTTSSSDLRRALWFLLRLAAFIAPVFFVVVAIEVALWRSGESVPVDSVVRHQTEAHAGLFLRDLFPEDIAAYKIALLARRAPEIVAVGSSRVMQLRAVMFAPEEEAFCNTGGMVNNASDFRTYAEWVLAGRSRPKAVIVEADPWWFKNDGSPDGTWFYPSESDSARSPGAHIALITRLVREGIRHPRSSQLAELVEASASPGQDALGLGAVNGDGFRWDGSFRYGTFIAEYDRTHAYRDREQPPIIERVRSAIDQFTPADSVDGDDLAIFVKAVDSLRAAGIEVLVIVMPMSTEVNRALSATPALSSWWKAFRADFPRAMSEHEIDATVVWSPADVGMTDDYMVDGFHPGEVLAAAVVRRALVQSVDGGVLHDVDIRALDRLVQASTRSPLSLVDTLTSPKPEGSD